MDRTLVFMRMRITMVLVVLVAVSTIMSQVKPHVPCPTNRSVENASDPLGSGGWKHHALVTEPARKICNSDAPPRAGTRDREYT